MSNQDRNARGSAQSAKAIASARLAKLRKSAKYHSFYNRSALEASLAMDTSAYAGKPVEKTLERMPWARLHS